MKCCCGSGLSTVLFALVGLTAIGVGGYNFATTGCPLGACADSACDSPVVAAGTLGGCDKATCADHANAKADCEKATCAGADGDKAACPETACPHDKHAEQTPVTQPQTAPEAPAADPA